MSQRAPSKHPGRASVQPVSVRHHSAAPSSPESPQNLGLWKPGDRLCLQAARLQGLFPFLECEERMPLVAGQLGSWRRWAGPLKELPPLPLLLSARTVLLAQSPSLTICPPQPSQIDFQSIILHTSPPSLKALVDGFLAAPRWCQQIPVPCL